ncbi:ParB N-terminal domain-containing protein [Photorhabdus khanii]|uniref:Uncharacterized protein n=1 Tax=Photorhabdus khanii subsp. guanajuatensis TaxID=2100166 RepID=A0A4R4K1Z3_9GAMM|nr:ParB N-terminal domain-containing protein [Photorhabdus khanii]TDB61334.1 hypothetical protein C5467_05245 [Photorhabdus khanii subsp. guanajuatensis]
MSQDKKMWWEKRFLRAVDSLKLWSDNPRLDPSSRLSTVRDYVEELISDSSEEQNFITLLKSIAERGFLSLDPIVVWKNEGNDFVVAEGNRRIMALKLLRSPNKAPLSIRKTVVNLSRIIDRDSIEKIRVCVAPSYEKALWYILQRHSTASIQSRWQRLQQQRFTINLYDSVDQDIDETINKTGFKRTAIIEALRYVKLRDIATRQEITKYLTSEEKELVYSHRISMTVLERWFGNSQVRDAWHIEFNEDGVSINADLPTFYAAYAKFLKLMLNKNNELGYMVNTRTIDSRFEEIFSCLPKVHSVDEGSVSTILPSPDLLKEDDKNTSTEPQTENDQPSSTDSNGSVIKLPLKGDPKRRQLTDIYHEITTRNYKLKALFVELQKLPVYSYPNVSAAAIRIFLELAVDEFISENDLQEVMAKRAKKSYNEVTLLLKLSTLRGEFVDDREANKIIDQLLHKDNDYSLNTLNEYVHGCKVHKVEPQFMNRFWDMLSPLFGVLISFKEI